MRAWSSGLGLGVILALMAGGLLAYIGLLALTSAVISVRVLLSVAGDPRFQSALATSFITSATSATAATLVSAFISYGLSRGLLPGSRIIEGVGLALLSSPPVGVGILVLALFTLNPMGKAVDSLVGFVFTPAGIMLAQFTVILPIALKLCKEVYDAIDRSMEESLLTMGYTPLKAMLKSTLPTALPGLIGAWIICWLRSVGEFGATVVIGGNIPFKTETLPVYMYTLLSSADLEGATAVIVINIAIGALGVYAHLALRDRVARP